MSAQTIEFQINDRAVKVAGYKMLWPLARFLRDELDLVGTKVVCEEGDCGACTVWMARGVYGQEAGKELAGKPEYITIDSCIYFVYQLHGCHIVTVEGISNGSLHPAQQKMIDNFGSQCGFCTPGFVMSLADMGWRNETTSNRDVKDACTGNLCRCTGYTSIMAAGEELNKSNCPTPWSLFDAAEVIDTFKAAGQTVTSDTTDPIGNEFAVTKPATVSEALQYLKDNPDTKLIAGGTDIGVQYNKGRLAKQFQYMAVGDLTELKSVSEEGDTLVIGSGATWTQLLPVFRDKYPEFAGILDIFAAPQIKNVATMGGNIINASPIADSIPFLMMMEAELVLAKYGSSGKDLRSVNINDFYKGYKDLDMNSGEMLYQIKLPATYRPDCMRLYKVSKRRDLDISIFTAAIGIEEAAGKVKRATVALGGVGPVVIRAKKTEAFLTGKKLDEAVCTEAGEIAKSEITPIYDVRASDDYRYALAGNIFLKYFYESQTAAV